MDNRAKIISLDELRQKAEERLKESEDRVGSLSLLDMKQLVHELGTFQIELEMQNEELRRAQEEIEESRRRYADLYDFAPVGYFTLDASGKILEANLSGAYMLGAERRLLLNRPFSVFVVPEDHETFRTHRRDVLAMHSRQTCEVRLNVKGASTIRVQLMSIAVEKEGGYVCRTAVSDVTAMREAEANMRLVEDEVRHIQRLESLRVLAGGVAHDLNNMLLAITGNAEFALGLLPEGSPASELLASIESTAHGAADIAGNMLRYAGKDEAVKRPVDLNQLVKDVTRMLAPVISREAKLTLNLDASIPPLMADPSQLQQVLMNLVINASDSLGDRPGSISVSTGMLEADAGLVSKLMPGHGVSGGGRYCFVEVADTGCGIDKDKMARIFEPFYTSKFAGRGLGLSAVQGIVSAHGGGIILDSEPDVGTTFRVLLRCNEALSRPLAEKFAAAPARGDGATILVVEDESNVLTLLTRVLESAGHRVLGAVDGEEAVGLFSKDPAKVDLVLMDMIMPGKSGGVAATEMRAIRPELPVIFASGYHELDLGPLMEGPGITRMLKKPYRMKALTDSIDEVIRESRPR